MINNLQVDPHTEIITYTCPVEKDERTPKATVNVLSYW